MTELKSRIHDKSNGLDYVKAMGSHRQKFDSPCKGRCRLRLPECQTHS